MTLTLFLALAPSHLAPSHLVPSDLAPTRLAPHPGVLVIGSIIGSLFGTLMFLPGLAMIFGGLKIKEQRFNSRAQGVCAYACACAVAGMRGRAR